MWAGVIRLGLPSTTSKPTFISGIDSQRLDQRVADQVGEGDLAAAGAGEVVVDDGAVVPEQLDRHRAHRGRGRHGQRGVHVLRRCGRARRAARCRSARRSAGAGRGRARLLRHRVGGALGRLGGLGLRARLGDRRGRRLGGLGGGFSGAAPAWPARACRPAWRRPAGRRSRRSRSSVAVPLPPLACPLALKYVAQVGVDAAGIPLVLVVHLLDEPLVGAEVGGRAGRTGYLGTAARLDSPLPVRARGVFRRQG